MVDTISGYFLCLLAHLVLISVLFFNQVRDSEVCHVQCRRSHSTGAVLVGIVPSVMPSLGVSLFSSSSHALSCLFLLKFIIDSHPVSNFWVLFALTSFPPLFINDFSKRTSGIR
uniref:Transmembrane protein 107 n=1 Tax=Angiostrongylus cantonensis TaxID=6313 RepID=A0A0K0DFP7_ANGCA